jgi:hypothetical protein
LGQEVFLLGLLLGLDLGESVVASWFCAKVLLGVLLLASLIFFYHDVFLEVRELDRILRSNRRLDVE